MFCRTTHAVLRCNLQSTIGFFSFHFKGEAQPGWGAAGGVPETSSPWLPPLSAIMLPVPRLWHRLLDVVQTAELQRGTQCLHAGWLCAWFQHLNICCQC